MTKLHTHTLKESTPDYYVGDIIWGVTPKLEGLPYEWVEEKTHPHLILKDYGDGTYLICPVSTSIPKWLKCLHKGWWGKDKKTSLTSPCGASLHSSYISEIPNTIKCEGSLSDKEWKELKDVIELSKSITSKYKLPTHPVEGNITKKKKTW